MKAVLFDLDGTLVDTTEFIYQAYEYVLDSHGLEVTKREIMAPMIGRGLHAIYTDIAPKGDLNSLVKSHIDFQEVNFHLIKPFKGVLEILKKLKKKGYRLGVVTSRLKNTSQTLKAVGIEPKLFEVIITGDDVKNIKPAPDAVLQALEKLKLKAGEAIVIGDGVHDIEMGKNAGVKTVGVTYGFGGEGIKKSKPDFVIDRIEELLNIV